MGVGARPPTHPLPAHLIITPSDAASELDCVLCLALAARQYNLARPRLSRGTALAIRGGRHLLAERLVAADGPGPGGGQQQYIPNDTRMGEDSARVQVSVGVRVGGEGGIRSASAQRPARCTTHTPHLPQVITGPNCSGKSCYAKQASGDRLCASVCAYAAGSTVLCSPPPAHLHTPMRRWRSSPSWPTWAALCLRRRQP